MAPRPTAETSSPCPSVRVCMGVPLRRWGRAWSPPSSPAPAGVRGRRPGRGGVDEHRQAGCLGDGEQVVHEVEAADDGVVDLLGAAAVLVHVVAGPPGTELLAAGGQLADEVVQARVVRGPARLGAQDADRVVGGLVPVDPEVVRGGVEEREPGVVGGPPLARGRTGEQGRVQRTPEGVRRQDVEPVVADRGRRTGHGVEHHLHADRHRRRRTPTGAGRAGAGGAGQVDQVLTLRLVELQRPGDASRIESDAPAEVPALEPHVVVGATRPRASRPPRGAAPARAGSRRTRSAPPAPASASPGVRRGSPVPRRGCPCRRPYDRSRRRGRSCQYL